MPPGASQNQQNVINGINNGICRRRRPAGFPEPVQSQRAAQLNALSQLAGEDNTGASTSTFQLMNDFFNLLSDMTFGAGGGGGSLGSGATGFARRRRMRSRRTWRWPIRASRRSSTAAPAAKLRPALDRLGLGLWRLRRATTAMPWSARTTLTAGDFGFAGGMDYHAAPDLKLGFALAGGGTNWILAQNLGSGRSDAFQIAGYGIKHYGPAYISRHGGVRQFLVHHQPHRGVRRSAAREFRRPELCGCAAKPAIALR